MPDKVICARYLEVRGPNPGIAKASPPCSGDLAESEELQSDTREQFIPLKYRDC